MNNVRSIPPTTRITMGPMNFLQVVQTNYNANRLPLNKFWIMLELLQ